MTNVSREELKKDIVPQLEAWLFKVAKERIDKVGRDAWGNRIWLHDEPEADASYITYEGTSWAFDFTDAQDGVVELADHTYELEPLNSYEVAVTLVWDNR